MKVKDLSKEQQEHFKQVVEYCKENDLGEQLEEATYLDIDTIASSLTKFTNGEEYYYPRYGVVWIKVRSHRKTNLYQKPEDYKDLLSPLVASTITWDWEDLKGKAVLVGVDPSESNGGSVVLMDELGNIYKVI